MNVKPDGLPIFEKEKAIFRFIKYSFFGTSTFLIDLFLLFLLKEIFDIYYIIAAGISFIFAISLHYALVRGFVFTETRRHFESGYIIFIAIALSGLFLLSGLMFVMVDLLGIQYLIARVLISGIVGLWDYFLNSRFNFKVGER